MLESEIGPEVNYCHDKSNSEQGSGSNSDSILESDSKIQKHFN